METPPLTLLSTLLLISLYFFFHHLLRCRNAPKLSPGPPPLPVIGNLHQLGNLPHCRLHSLAKSYGPIMFLRLGNKPTVVVSSPEVAELVLKTHDSIFSSRPSVDALHHLSYGNKGRAFAESGVYWRGLRRLCMLQLLSPAKVESFTPMRREELGMMVRRVTAAAAVREAVDVSAEVGQLMGDLACRMILGCSTRDKFNLKPVTNEARNLAGAFNLADYVPLLGALDLQGMTRRAKAVNRAMDKVFEDIIREYEEDTTGKYKGDFIDTLLAGMGHPINSSQDEQVHIMGRTNVKAIALDMIAASYESLSTAIEWSLSELIRNPRVMKHLQQELEAVVGLGRTVEESDMLELNYLDMVVKESLRLQLIRKLELLNQNTKQPSFYTIYATRKAPKLPPGPPPLPIIGNLHHVPHHRLRSLAKAYGSIMFLRLGNKLMVVVLLPEVAKLILRTHNSIFSSRLSMEDKFNFNLKPVIHEFMNLAGAFNLADYVPAGSSGNHLQPANGDFTTRHSVSHSSNHSLLLFHHLHRRKAPKLPPGPPLLPIIRNLHQLGNPPHRRLHSLSKSYGPIMFLRLGNKPTVVVSLPEAAELILKTHDGIFSSGPSWEALGHMSYSNTGIAFVENGAYWQGVRRLCMLHLLSPAKVESFAPMRREELGRVVGRVRRAAAAREAVDVSAEVGS
ncbi:hypothetical protein NL676_003649 [Syzygium grande]|nr:hypothetical protein NL676_003649 [Syzygium grande]